MNLSLLIAAFIAVQDPTTAPVVVTQSKTFAKQAVTAPNTFEDAKQASYIVRGDNLVVDFGGSTIQGTSATAEPDQRRGTAVVVEGKNVTIRNLVARGYKFGLIANGAHGLKLENCDFSHGYRPKLRSTLEGEDGSDWMSFHRNEQDEWMRFGAGVYLRDCDGIEVKGLTVQNAACGLMLTECDNGLVWNSNLSFLSAVGLGMYKSDDNRVMHNKIDWCLRGYSHGIWNRGQDSTGILAFDSVDRNVFAYNSVTHGGDGFFLWAGQSTMDNGEGGSNDNLLYGNDFSHAPTNGIEVTFSRTAIVNNKILECWHGIWGGYSFQSPIIGNVFGLNSESIAIEHGNDIAIRRNRFLNDLYSIVLWQNPGTNRGPFARDRETDSRSYQIRENVFDGIAGAALNLRTTQDVTFVDNKLLRSKQLFDKATARVSVRGGLPYREGSLPGLVVRRNEVRTDKTDLPEFAGAVEFLGQDAPAPKTHIDLGGRVVIDGNWNTAEYLAKFDVPWSPLPGTASPRDPAIKEIETWAPAPLRGAHDAFLPKGTLRGRRYMLVDEWGPYDFRRPQLWPRDVSGMVASPEHAERLKTKKTRTFEVLGPPGAWKLVSKKGVKSTSSTSGRVPGFVEIEFEPEYRGTVDLRLEYVGAETADHRGLVTPAGKPVAFGYSQYRMPIAWDVRWYAWDPETQDPRTQADAYEKAKSVEPLTRSKTDELDFRWNGRPIGPNLPASHFATVAEANSVFEKGDYALEVTTDDGIRVWLDGKLILDEWRHQNPSRFTVPLKLSGKHKLRVEHFQIDGFSVLRAEIKPTSR